MPIVDSGAQAARTRAGKFASLHREIVQVILQSRHEGATLGYKAVASTPEEFAQLDRVIKTYTGNCTKIVFKRCVNWPLLISPRGERAYCG